MNTDKISGVMSLKHIFSNIYTKETIKLLFELTRPRKSLLTLLQSWSYFYLKSQHFFRPRIFPFPMIFEIFMDMKLV